MQTALWESAGITHVGKVRSANEDSILDKPDAGIWVVADGMGGHDAGDVASQSIVGALAAIPASSRLSDLVDQVEDALLAVNRKLRTLAGTGDSARVIGSTVVAAMASGANMVFMWAGDSRIYLLRDDTLVQVSQDHSQIEDMIGRGEITREESESHPSANVITRAVGGAHELVIDMECMQGKPGDRVLLCSDGLTKELTDAEIGQKLLSRTSAQSVCHALIGAALDKGCRDNVSVVLVDFKASR